MECTVRYVHEVNFKGEQIGGVKPSLCFRGEKIAHAVINDDTAIRVIEVTLESHDKASPVLYHGEPYDPLAYAERLLMSSKAAAKPVTRRARYLLLSRSQANETTLPPEEVEATEQVRTYADNTPAERIKAGKRPGPVEDKTEEFKNRDLPPVVDSEKPQKPPKKGSNGKAAPITRADVKAAHEAARKAIAPTKEKAKSTLPNGEKGKLIRKLANEFHKTTFELRLLIRSTGMRAPYDGREKEIRKALKGKV